MTTPALSIRPIAAAPATRSEIGFFGGKPIFDVPLEIVRPRFPALDTFGARFQDALRSGNVTNNGRWVLEFERQLTEYLGVPTATFCNGQTAMMAMLRAAGIAGGEVIVPAFTFSATPHAVRWCNADPVFADVLPDSMCLDPAHVERKITSKTKAILGVDVYGIACEYAELGELARRHGLKLLFDSAPAFGTRVDGRLVGGFGDAQMLSFHATKAFATMEGGCICSHNDALLKRAKAIRNFGQDPVGDCDEAGINGKLTEVCALIGIEQLKAFETAARARRRAAHRICAGLEVLPGLSLARPGSNQEPIWLYLPVVIDKRAYGLDRDATTVVFAKENLHVRKYYSPPCHHLKAYRGRQIEKLPHSEAIAYNVIALPIYNDMTDAEADGIVRVFVDVHRESKRIAQALG